MLHHLFQNYENGEKFNWDLTREKIKDKCFSPKSHKNYTEKAILDLVRSNQKDKAETKVFREQIKDLIQEYQLYIEKSST